MEFSKASVVDMTLESGKTSAAEEMLDEVVNNITSSARCGLWQTQIVTNNQDETQAMLWVSAKLQRMGFEVIMVRPDTFSISWQN